MARCASDGCQRWCPDVIARRGAGTSIDGHWFCSEACVERMARLRLAAARPSAARAGVPPLRLGVLLRHAGAVSAADLTLALAEQRQTGLRLGAQLRLMGAVEPEAVLRALAAQAGVSSIAALDPLAVRDAPGRLSPHALRALSLIPFSHPEGGRIRVAVAAPVPRAALNALQQLTGWVPEPFLVDDDHWHVLLEHYGADVSDREWSARPVELVEAQSVSDAAARIAAAATSVRHTTVVEAHWDPYTWIRVQGDGLTQDVLLNNVETEEMPCLAANTSH